jgi:YHYH protein
MFACRAGNPTAGGAQVDGPWLNNAAGTWDSTTKLKVNGEVSWPTAKYTETVSGGKRILTTNSLPVDYKTGTFPIGANDPSYAYDRNPGTITEKTVTLTLAENGTVASAPTCMNEGPVGMLRNGVYIFNAVDARGDDAVAHESQDLCDGHPAMTQYHYHSVPSCIRTASTGPSTVVGWMADGFPLVVERDASGHLPTNADLDECHGRTSPILIDGNTVTTYHYSATLEFPYTIGCYKGTAAAISR